MTMKLIAAIFVILFLTSIASRRADGADQAPDVTTPRSEAAALLMPAELVDIHGRTVNLRELAKRQQLIVVTMKATWCRVCLQQLRRLRRLQSQLEQCGATFIVLSPGPLEKLREVERQVDFPFPFVEDVNLDLARRLDLELRTDQIVPALFSVDPSGRIGWMQRGRAPGLYADDILLELLECEDRGPSHRANAPQGDRLTN
jgi:cytochrome c biogenesis protein CcmG/thiol:disulfide interchange protein DsbE